MRFSTTLIAAFATAVFAQTPSTSAATPATPTSSGTGIVSPTFSSKKTNTVSATLSVPVYTYPPYYGQGTSCYESAPVYGATSVPVYGGSSAAPTAPVYGGSSAAPTAPVYGGSSAAPTAPVYGGSTAAPHPSGYTGAGNQNAAQLGAAVLAAGLAILI